MVRMGMLLMGAAVLAMSAGADGAYQNFFATQVVSYDPGTGNGGFSDPSLALGGPRGRNTGNGSLHVVTLGVQGSLTLGFEPGTAIANGPGADFIVFENAFGSSNWAFSELVRVEVSSDGAHFAQFPTYCGITSPIGPYDMMNPQLVSGFAGRLPVYANVDTNSISPFDPNAAGGDAFDLSGLAADPLVVAGTVDLMHVRYVRLIDVLGDGSEHDSSGNAIYDPAGTMVPTPPYSSQPTSADIDAISVIHGVPIWGDTNDDGVVNVTDLNNVYNNLGTTGPVGETNGDGVIDVIDMNNVYNNLGTSIGATGAGAVPEPASVCLLPALAVLLRRRKTSLRR